MSKGIDRLRAFGPLGNLAANAIALLSTNWAVVVSALVGAWAALNDWAYGFVSDPRLHVGILVFLAVLWSYIGIVYLIDRNKPRAVRTAPDYRYGLTFEGLIPAIDPNYDAQWLGFGVQVRNFSQAPIRYMVDHLDVRIETRTLPESTTPKLKVYLPRGAGRTTGAGAFKKDDVKEFFGKRVKGTVRCVIIYGHPETPPVRRLRINIEITLGLNETGDPPWAFGADIKEEMDEPYSSAD